MRKFLYALAAIATLAALAMYLRPVELALLATRARLRNQGERSANIQVDGYRIHYREMGQGKPLLLVHGLGADSLVWANVMPRLAQAGYHVVALDLLGYGKSQAPDIEYSIAKETQIVSDFLRAKNLSQADVVGWSMGGWIALDLTVSHPEQVHRLVLEDSAGLKYLPAFDTRLLSPKTVQSVQDMFLLMEPETKRLPSYVARDLLRRRVTGDGWVVDRALISMLQGKDILDGKMAAVQQPVLLLWGKQDKVTPLELANGMMQGMPQASLVVFDNCGHLAPTACAGPVTDKLLAFLNADEPPRGMRSEISVAH